MIDDDDVSFFVLAMPVVGPVTLVLFIAGFIVLSVRACENDEACSKRHCDTGSAELMHGQCLCVQEASK